MLIKLMLTDDMKSFSEKEIYIGDLSPVVQAEWMSLQPGMFIHYDGKIHAVVGSHRMFKSDGSLAKEIRIKSLSNDELAHIEAQVRMSALQQDQDQRMQKAGIVQATSIPSDLRG